MHLILLPFILLFRLVVHILRVLFAILLHIGRVIVKFFVFVVGLSDDVPIFIVAMFARIAALPSKLFKSWGNKNV